MLNLPAIRVSMVVILMLLLGCMTIRASAQVLPLAPGFPTEAKQCQSFSSEVEAYTAEYTEQHDKCLADRKPDRQVENEDLTTCTRSSCQYLHDILHGDSILSAKSLAAEVSSCYAKVTEYQAREAQRANEEAERKAQEEKDEAEQEARDNQHKLDRAARRQRDEDARAARDKQEVVDQAERERDEERRSAQEKQAESDRIDAQQNQQSAPAPTNPASQASQMDSRSSQDSKTFSRLVDPFADSAQSGQAAIVASASLVDPFASKESLVDPFGASSADTKSSTGTSENDNAAFEVSAGAIELSTKKAVSKLDQDLVFIRSQSGKTINRAEASELIQEITETKSVLKILNGFVTGGQYVVLLKEIASADSSGKRDEAWGNLIKQGSSDVLHTDLVKDGMTKVAPRLFGERIGLMLAGAAEASSASGAILLDSTKTGRDPTETIHDSSGKVSLSEKQSALMNMWNGYERRQSQTNDNSDEALRRELWINSNIVYNQCLEARSDCERWKSLLNHQ